MGKRIKWLNDAEADLIRESKLDYSQFYSPVHSSVDDQQGSKEELMQAFKQLEKTRLQNVRYQSGNQAMTIGFICPSYVEKQIEKIKSQKMAEAEEAYKQVNKI